MKAARTNLPPRKGIFQITNLTNGRILIGKSNDLDAAINRHRLELREGSHRNAQLQKDWKDFGEGAFRFAVLEVLTLKNDPGYDSTKELDILESLWLEKLQPYGKKGYNGEPKKKG